MKEFTNESVPVFSGLYQISYVARRYTFEVDIIYFPYIYSDLFCLLIVGVEGYWCT